MSSRLQHRKLPNRREFIALGCMAGAAALGSPLTASQPSVVASDISLEIARYKLQVSPHRTIDTVAYNGQVPGPLFRLQAGKQVRVQVSNQTALPEIVHWHGLFLPSDVDGAMEEGSPLIAPGARAVYTITPQPTGFRWFHTHTFAGNDLRRAQYTGQHGLLMIQDKQETGDYDAEAFLTLHDWEGHLTGSDDGSMNPTYDVSTINGRVFGFGEPLRVRQGQQLLLHIVNTSPTEVHWIAFAGHSFRVLALDGNPVPSPQTVPMLRLSPAERISASVLMNNPGAWVLGEVRRHVRSAGMGMSVEYAGYGGAPRWDQPETLDWGYLRFGTVSPVLSADDATVIPLVFKSKFRGHGSEESWTINGRSYPDVQMPRLRKGERYRLRMVNLSADDHPMHLHRHSFELRFVENRATAGVIKDTVLVPAGKTCEVEFIANAPGASLFHCHQQNHMDKGFMGLFQYA